jgi:transcriptional regulator with PAS, ATPase and Fis domain
MRKKVAIVTNAKEVISAYATQLKTLFGDLVETELYNFEDGSAKNIKKTDLYLISTSACEFFDDKFLKNKNVVICDLTITKDKLEFLKKFPEGTRAVLFNVTVKMTYETISCLYHLGVNNIEMLPGYPQMKELPDAPIIITPAETALIPEKYLDREIVDIGHRVLDANTIIEIALKLEYEHILYYKEIKEYLKTVASNDFSLNEEKATTAESQLQILLKTMDIGIVGVDKDNYVCACNEGAEKILSRKTAALLGERVDIFFPSIPFDEVKKSKKEIKSRLIKINDQPINLNITPIVRADNYMGAFAFIQKFQDEELKQQELRRQLMNKGHVAKYNFDDIIGDSLQITKIKDIAKKMSKTNAAVLITGESGTGKELFAHSIHNYSERKDSPFVAINCAAIPENLLESELFGYEEGAFTGAKKGGKIGLFEFAHMGTLFLDEIEGMSPSLQIKLLRVIQEKEIMKIGGDKVIKIDVRLIAATNENLKSLMKEGKFRKDLYYRINTLPIIIPPLRERKEDISLLMNKFIKEIGGEFIFSKRAKEAFDFYNWEGNIREMKNYAEFFSYLDKEIIEYEDLPAAITDYFEEEYQKDSDIKEESSDEEKLRKKAGSRYSSYIFIMKKIKESNIAGKSSGRKGLAAECSKNNIILSEQEIRKILKDLEEIELIEVYKGRKGSVLSEKGRKFIK